MQLQNMNMSPAVLDAVSKHLATQKLDNGYDITPLLPQSKKPATIWDSISPGNSPFGNLFKVLENIVTTKLAMIQLNDSVDTDQDSGEDYEKYLQFPNDTVKALASTIVKPGDSDDTKMYKIEQWVQDNITYVSDEEQYKEMELWAFPTMTINSKEGDCIACHEEIYTKEGIKRVGDLKVGDLVLSYDFNSKRFVYRPIVKIWEKGYLPAKRVWYRNGSTNVLTNDHPMITRTNQVGESKYEKTHLSDVDLGRWWKRKIPIARKIPYEVKDIEWLTEELCFVLGHYLAEGWNSGGKIETSGYDIPNSIVPILEKFEIPFSPYENNSGVPCVRFLQSHFKEFLRKQKTNSFYIHLEERLFHLPENKLRAILDGHLLGDGHYSDYPDKRGYKSNKKYVHSTSSIKFVWDLQRIALQLGFSFHVWKQVFHGGAGDKEDGKHPIYRLSYNPCSFFLKDYGYENISEVSIKKIEDLPKLKMRDFTVAGTHNFVCKNGNLYHNCEDGAFLIHSLALNAGVNPDRLRTYGGIVSTNYGASVGGHAWTSYKRETDNEWIILDWCYWAQSSPLSEREPMSEDLKYIDDWFFITATKTVETPYSNRVRFAGAYPNYNTSSKPLIFSTTV